MTIRVDNLPKTLAAVRKIDSELAKELNREIYAIGKPIRDRARSYVPTKPPLSQWTTKRQNKAGEETPYPWRKQARTGIAIERGAGKKSGQRRLTNASGRLLSVKQTNTAGAIFDLAGAGNYSRTPQGEAFKRNLNARYGRGSRTMWRAAEFEQTRTEAAFSLVVAKAQRRLTQELD